MWQCRKTPVSETYKLSLGIHFVFECQITQLPLVIIGQVVKVKVVPVLN
jgi:hypothetical protein